MTASNTTPGHIPVMTTQMLGALNPKPHGLYIDATLGGGGHSRAILQSHNCRVIAFDRDPAVTPHADSLASDFGPRFQFVRARFSQMENELRKINPDPVDGITLDLGLSSIQLDDHSRGFSFQHNAPLDMSMDGTQSRESASVADLLAAIDHKSLAEILALEGEEPHAQRIARAIINSSAPVRTTSELSRIAENATNAKGPKLRKQLARIFQALRRHINDEAAELEAALLAAARILTQDGRCVIISFHSLEDRVVKHAFAAKKIGAVNEAVESNEVAAPFAPTQSLARPSAQECARNPRARSARLRAARRTAAPRPKNIWWKSAA